MKLSWLLKVAMVLTCLFGFTVTAWSVEVSKMNKSAQDIVGQIAIVSGIDNGKIMLTSASDVSKKCDIPLSSSGELLKVGDKVKVEGNIVKKILEEIDPPAKSPPATK